MQLLIEEEPRFNPFNLQAWGEFNSAMARAGGACVETRTEHVAGVEQVTEVCVVLGSPFDGLPLMIVDMVNENLPQAVTYRRRDYEQDAMMRALCERNGVMLPPAAEHVRTGVGGAAEQTDEPEPEPKLEPQAQASAPAAPNQRQRFGALVRQSWLDTAASERAVSPEPAPIAPRALESSSPPSVAMEAQSIAFHKLQVRDRPSAQRQPARAGTPRPHSSAPLPRRWSLGR